MKSRSYTSKKKSTFAPKREGSAFAPRGFAVQPQKIDMPAAKEASPGDLLDVYFRQQRELSRGTQGRSAEGLVNNEVGFHAQPFQRQADHQPSSNKDDGGQVLQLLLLDDIRTEAVRVFDLAMDGKAPDGVSEVDWANIYPTLSEEQLIAAAKEQLTIHGVGVGANAGFGPLALEGFQVFVGNGWSGGGGAVTTPDKVNSLNAVREEQFVPHLLHEAGHSLVISDITNEVVKAEIQKFKTAGVDAAKQANSEDTSLMANPILWAEEVMADVTGLYMTLAKGDNIDIDAASEDFATDAGTVDHPPGDLRIKLMKEFKSVLVKNVQASGLKGG